MLSSLIDLAKSTGGVVGRGLNIAKGIQGIAISIGIKGIKYFIDSEFRKKVTPIPGSVLYCDLWVGAEHSGIYVDDGKISNIEVTGVAEGTVSLSDPQDFTSKSALGRKIYVSSNGKGAVGHPVAAHGANSHVGERSLYGLVIKNCHQFSTKCVNYVGDQRAIDASLMNTALSLLPIPDMEGTWEPTIKELKNAARQKLGATKWRLWDWENESEQDPPSEPDWNALNDALKNQPLDASAIEQMRAELQATQAYEEEIADEIIPANISECLAAYRQTLSDISQKYEEAKSFLNVCPDARFSYNDLKDSSENFAELAKTLQGSQTIQELARKLGRNYISEEKKKQAKIPQTSKSEVHGTHRSDDVMRVLPSELLNLEDETLETLFYARLLEKNLLTYELKGVTFIAGETTETAKKRTGPVVACLDTSASMQGAPLTKAKALLLVIASILEKEDRSLHVLLFGGSGELREFSMDAKNDSAGLLRFLGKGFNGGTDFETPMQRGFDIIALHEDYKKADMLMITDGACSLSARFLKTVKGQKEKLDCSIYTVLCAGAFALDAFSDEVVVL